MDVTKYADGYFYKWRTWKGIRKNVLDLYKRQDGEEQKAPEIGMFTSEGVDSETSSQNREREAVHRATILYDKDGTYTFNVSYTDLAGNMAKEYPEDRFTIDPVSYTHLDVYKRQFSCLWAYRRRAAADKRPDLCAERN